MTGGRVIIVILTVAAWCSGCATYDRRGLEAAQARAQEQAAWHRMPALPADLAARVRAMDADHVTARDIEEVLGHCPAPRIVNIHGGIFPVHRRMISFSKFLVGMGYPELSLTNPADGTYTFSCYESSDTIAGAIAWHYEKEGLRPMMVGHSQGGIQVVKVLRKLAGLSGDKVAVWNPLTWRAEDRYDIRDPLTGLRRPVVGLRLPYATAVGAGGLARVLPNQWDMTGRLRGIPDSVEEFTGFYKGLDLLGGDYLGYGSANHYAAQGQTVVRTVCLPSAYRHGSIPNTEHLLKSQAIKDWINAYRPPAEPVHEARLDREFDTDSRHILWAADVWFSIKKHWVLELQRALQAKPSSAHAS